jgi:Protein of unknown function (DUF1257)
MSENIVCKSTFKDIEVLKEALVEIGVPLDKVKVHENAVELSGGYRIKHLAEIVIPAGQGHHHDIGFKLEKDGTYSSIVYDSDARSGIGAKVMNGVLAQQYSKAVILRTIRKTYGHKLKSCVNKNGKIEITVSVM